MKQLFLFFAFMFFPIAMTVAQTDSVTFSEIMFYPLPNNPYVNEFVEIYNFGSQPVNLNNWKIRDNNALDTIVNAGFGTILQPGQFAVVFVNNYDLDTGQYHGLVPPTALILKFGNNTIGNGLGLTDSIRLINPAGDTISRVRWNYSSFTYEYSIEKVILNTHDNSSANWEKTLVSNGTPGFINSVSPKTRDLSIISSDIAFTPPFPDAGQPFTVWAKIKNPGTDPANNFQVRFSRIIESDTMTVSLQTVSTSAAGDSVTLSATDTAYAQGQWAVVTILWPEDQYLTNNTAQRQVFFSGSYNKIVVNEIMYAPTTALGYKEWVEIYNRSSDTLNIKNWKFADVSRIGNPLTITTEDHWLAPGDYFILCEDTAAFNMQYSNPPVRKLRIASWPGLNNDLDMVVIQNHLGVIIDSVFYASGWGGDKDGKSLERRDPDISSNQSSNWGTSLAQSGATPGALNSLTSAAYDAGIAAINFIPPYPEKNQIFSIEVVIKNYGQQAADTCMVSVFRKGIADSLLLLQTTLMDLSDSLSLLISDTAWISGQIYRAEVVFAKDQKIFNNATTKTLIFGAPRNCMVINEIMYSPLTGNAEWIEVVNRSADTLDLRKWMIADEAAFTSNSLKTIVSTSQRIAPGEFIIICEDSVKFKAQYPWVTARKFRPSAWVTLNESDMIVITDSLKKIVDSLFYEKSWGGGSNLTLERIDVNGSSTSSANWGSSIALAGATPGNVNSLTVVPFDAGIAGLRFEPPYPEKGQIFQSVITVRNYGYQTADTIVLRYYRFRGNDSVLLYQTTVFDLTDSVVLSVIDTAAQSGQIYRAEIIYTKDEKSFNNVVSRTLIFGAPRSCMVINEIMYSPLTGNAEWIEVVNRSADTLDLRKWMIADEAAFTSNSLKTIVATSQRIAPGEFIIICEDSVKFKTQYPWVTARKFRPSAWVALNESDMIVITDSLKKIVDSLFYEKSWGGGSNRSLERIDINGSSVSSENWGSCISPNGATPGVPNSITPFDLDIAVYPSDFTHQPAFPQPGDTLILQAIIRNVGLLSVSVPFKTYLFEDANFDGTGQPSECLDSVSIDSLPAGQMIGYVFRYPTIASGSYKRMMQKYLASADSIRFLLRADYSADQRPENNQAGKTIRLGIAPRSVVINEILYYPDTSQVEFVELFNRSADTLNLKNWTIADASPTSKKIISATDWYFRPGEWIVITGDTTVYRKYPDVPAGNIIIVKSLAAFNNDKDAVVVKDAIGAIVDSVYYYNSWGGRKGISLERISVHRPSNDPGNWGSSIAVGGASPGRANGILSARPAYRHAVVINEIMYAPFSGEPEYIEIYNPTDSTINLANWSLQVNETKVIPTTTSFEIPAGEYVVFSENKIMPARYKTIPRLIRISSMPGLSNNGATIMIRDMLGTVIDSVTYDPDWGGQNGLSLERIKPTGGSNIRLNWGSCMFVEGGTPGFLNSIFTGEDQPDKIKLSAEPNPFFVDRNEQTKITIELPVTQARLTLKIYDNQGRLIRTLLNNSYSGSYREVYWDGKDQNGQYARMGIYVMYLEALNENPKYHKSAKKTVVLGRKL